MQKLQEIKAIIQAGRALTTTAFVPQETGKQKTLTLVPGTICLAVRKGKKKVAVALQFHNAEEIPYPS